MTEQTHDQESAIENVGRIFARGLVIAGGVFWMIAAFSGPYMFKDMSLIESVQTAMWPFVAAMVILLMGWVYERLAAVLLFAASAAVVVWGSMYAWEMGVWILMSFVLVAPMMLAAVLFLLAGSAEARRSFPSEPQHPVTIPEFELARGIKHARGIGIGTGLH